MLDELQLSATIGYYAAENFVSAEFDGTDVESGTADPAGLTDLWIVAKWRIIKQEKFSGALLGGLKLPTGKDDVLLSNGEPLEPSSQPGTGAVDFLAGGSGTFTFTDRIALDMSGQYTFRTWHDGFKVGDRMDAGLALSYRLTEDEHHYPRFSVFGESIFTWIGKDQGNAEENPNSGGFFIFLSPGLRVSFSQNVTLTVAPAFPALQDLNGLQDKTDFRITAVLSMTF